MFLLNEILFIFSFFEGHLKLLEHEKNALVSLAMYYVFLDKPIVF